MNKTLHIRSKVTRENMKSDKMCTKRCKRQVIKTKKRLDNNRTKKLFKRIYKILRAIKITLRGWSQTACSRLALVLL